MRGGGTGFLLEGKRKKEGFFFWVGEGVEVMCEKPGKLCGHRCVEAESIAAAAAASISHSPCELLKGMDLLSRTLHSIFLK